MIYNPIRLELKKAEDKAKNSSLESLREQSNIGCLNKSHIDSDYDFEKSQRIISGRLTPKRYKLISHAVRKWNNEHSAPYGRSKDGYAYNCGCEHDCCGCMTGENIKLDFATIGVNRVQIKLIHSVGFNY